MTFQATSWPATTKAAAIAASTSVLLRIGMRFTLTATGRTRILLDGDADPPPVGRRGETPGLASRHITRQEGHLVKHALLIGTLALVAAAAIAVTAQGKSARTL